MKRLVATLVLLVVAAATQAANVLYVADTLKVPLRSGQGNEYRIVAFMESGAKLDVLEAGTEFTRVRDAKGKEGWIRNEYVTGTPVARDRLAWAEKKMAALEADKKTLREQLMGVEGERKGVSTTLTQIEKEKQRLEKELADLRESAANPLKLADENKVMRDRLAALEDDMGRLRAENEQLGNDSARKWVVTGAGILGGGILIGLVLPKLRRRRSSWGSDF